MVLQIVLDVFSSRQELHFLHTSEDESFPEDAERKEQASSLKAYPIQTELAIRVEVMY